MQDCVEFSLKSASGPIRNEPHPTDQQQALSIHIPYLDYVLEIPELIEKVVAELLKNYETPDKSFKERTRIIKMAKSLTQVNKKVRDATRSVLFSTGVGFHVVADRATAKNLSSFTQREIPLNNLLPVFFYLTDQLVEDTQALQFISQHSSNIIGMDYKTRSPSSETLHTFKNASFHNLRLLELTIEDGLRQVGPNLKTQNMISLFADLMRNSPGLETVFYVDARTAGLCNSKYSERIMLPKTLSFLAIDTHSWSVVKNLTFPKGLPHLEHLHIQSQTDASMCNCVDPEVTAEINFLLRSVHSTMKQMSVTSFGVPYQLTVCIPPMGQLELLKLRDINIILQTPTASMITPFPQLRHLSVKSSYTTVLNTLFGAKFENVDRFKYCGLRVEPCQSVLKVGGKNELDIFLTERLVGNFPNCTKLSLSWSSHASMFACMPIIFQHMTQLKKFTVKIGCKYWDDATLSDLAQVLTGIAPGVLKELTSVEWSDLEWSISSLYNLKALEHFKLHNFVDDEPLVDLEHETSDLDIWSNYLIQHLLMKMEHLEILDLRNMPKINTYLKSDWIASGRHLQEKLLN